nr:hypothetical protein [Tanacetum cinerariifolium]
MMTDRDSSAQSLIPITPLVPTRPVYSEVLKEVSKIKECLTGFEQIIENIKHLSQNLDTSICNEVKKFKTSLDELHRDYQKCRDDKHSLSTKDSMHVIQNVLYEEKIKDISLKNEQCVTKIARLDYLNRRCAAKKRDLRIQQQNHLLQYDDLIAADLAKEVGLIVLASEKVCETPNATASNALFEFNKLKAQLQARDDVICHLQAEKDILSLLTVGPTDSSLDT